MSVSARMRWASRAQFFGSGFIFATWGVHIPTVKSHYGVDEAALGLAMLAAGVGALLGLTQASRWIGRHGARGTAGLCGAIYALLLAGLLVMPGYAALLGLLAVFGVLTGVFDVAINTEAAQLELRNGHPLMSGMHGMFSLGGMAGAVTGGAALAAGMAPQSHLTLVAAAMALSIALSVQMDAAEGRDHVRQHGRRLSPAARRAGGPRRARRAGADRRRARSTTGACST